MSKKLVHPPYLAKKLLSFMRHYSEEYSSGGDLVEEYRETAKERGRCTAYLWYWWQVFYAIPTYILLHIELGGIMFKNYFKIALRNMKKHKGFSFISIAGLAIGMACYIFIFLYVRYEMSFDKFHIKSSRIYRIVQRFPGTVYLGQDYFATTPPPLAQALISEYSEVISATTLGAINNVLLSKDDDKYFENGIYADGHFFHIFSFPLVFGVKETALSNPFSIVITEKLAHKYFKDGNPLGKTIRIDNRRDMTITGVCQNIPKNSHIQFDFIISLISQGERQLQNWQSNGYYTYFELKENCHYKTLEEKLSSLNGMYRDYDVKFILQPLSDIHLKSNLNWEFSTNGDIKNIYLFRSIGFTILLLAFINFINLSTVRSTKRAKEIGLRKVIGAQRRHIISQFLGESIVFTLTSLLLVFVIVLAILPHFRFFVAREIEITIFDMVYFTFIIFSLGLASSCCPALVISSLKTVTALKSSFYLKPKGSSLRNVLVIFQFFISIVLITGTIIIYKQLQFITNKNLGYKKEQIIYIPLRDSRILRNYQPLKNTLLQNPSITDVTLSRHLPSQILYRSPFFWIDKNGNQRNEQFYFTYVDYNFLDFFDIGLLSGRKISEKYSTDKKGIFLNETAVKRLNLNDPLGKTVSLGEMGNEHVIGIINDFHFAPLRQRIEPLVLIYDPERSEYRYLSVKIKFDNVSGDINFLNNTYKKFSPIYPFEYYFLDENLNNAYNSERKLGFLVGFFSVIAIFIACLGLFGLASFTVERRTKEVGIRKVLGASVKSIIRLVSKEFVVLVLMANCIALPVAYYFMNKWLQNFAYQIHIGLGVFLVSGAIALVIALLSVSYQSIKAATANPVDSLRYE